MANTVQMQTVDCSNLDPGKFCSFDIEVIDGPTTPLIHTAARFLLINSGRGVIRVQGRDYALRPGSLVAIMPWEITEVVEVSAPLQFFIVVYRFDVVNEIVKAFFHQDSREAEIIRRMTAEPVVHCGRERLPGVTDLFLAIRDEVGVESTRSHPERRPLGEIQVTGQLLQLIITYLRLDGGQEGTGAPRGSGMDPSEILTYLYNHLSEKVTLRALSHMFNMSEYAISRYIRRVTGLSFFDLLGEMRVGKTVSFLLYTDLTLDELAEILGYVDAAHVSKVFSARVGMRASEYRKTYQSLGALCKIRESRAAYDVVAYLYRHYSEPLTPQGVAGVFGMSVQQLQKTLLYQVEKNFGDFLHLIRINRASALLSQTDKSILDIAVEVGYNNVKTFSRHFLKLRVMTPGQYRKNVGLQADL